VLLSAFVPLRRRHFFEGTTRGDDNSGNHGDHPADTSTATQDGGSCPNNPTAPITTGVGRRGISAPPPPPLTAAQRATVVTALLAGSVTVLVDVLALIATAATGGVTQQQVYRVIAFNDATLG
jgi:hypothetical protein